MKKLMNLVELSSRVAVYVPSTVNVDKKVSNKKYVDKVLTDLSGWFGGATSTKAIGSWLTQSNTLVRENVTVVYAFCTTDLLEQYGDNVIDLCEQLKKDMSQEAISLEINGKLYFV
jgi:hypothetical protein